MEMLLPASPFFFASHSEKAVVIPSAQAILAAGAILSALAE
jgi:hypothetical protein